MLYYQLNIDYIIETYCVNKEKPKLQCNGKCYLSKQLKKANNSTEGTTKSAVIEAFFPQYFEEPTPIQFTNHFFQLKKKNWRKSDQLNSLFLSVLVPPPKMA